MNFQIKRKLARNIGNNYALALKSGGNTHITIVYFNNVKRGFEQERVKTLAEEYLRQTQFPASVRIQLGEMVTDRCFAVVNDDLIRLQRELHAHFATLGYDLRAIVPLHIDLRGESVHDAVDDVISTTNWNF